MGYQVGNTCYNDFATAENVYFSQVAPTIAADGKLKQLVYDGKNWKYESRLVHASLPKCSQLDNYLAGFEMVSSLLPTAIVLFAGKLIIDKLK
ncbi:hypothetical protein QG041_08995 [Kingella kingae]|uniref:hypothetical protein n=2 Tax=Pseudomonadota TaxID=1224 RepID=UPI00050A2D40|nr:MULTISPECIES: hypothetical protein [Pseudomonadota]MCG9766857.1 hypothetical protein [Vibrio alginolyticus]MDK4571408.1 hypothetical protein [Kingella kingae]MDK4571417.1 hypothetical protein [Kingella kingae]MDK4653205.1 hypothetical protein [Kingella kingae]MDK4665097.1 hypothetical protein [Kingella kingae]